VKCAHEIINTRVKLKNCKNRIKQIIFKETKKEDKECDEVYIEE
jgi:hypothetical protein